MSEGRLKFREFYAERFHRANEGEHWAGRNGEDVFVVQKRIADAMADYADYIFEFPNAARWGGE